MMYGVTSEWVAEFLSDIEGSATEKEAIGNQLSFMSSRGAASGRPNAPNSGKLPSPMRSTSPAVSRASTPSPSRTRSPSPSSCGVTVPLSSRGDKRSNPSHAGRPPPPGGLAASVTVRLKKINKDLRRNEVLAEKVKRWKEIFRQRGDSYRLCFPFYFFANLTSVSIAFHE